MQRRSSKPPIFPSQLIFRTDSVIRPTAAPRPFDSPLQLDSLEDRSRTPQAIHPIPSTNFNTLQIGSRQRLRRPVTINSSSPHEPKTFFTANPTLPTPSAACRPLPTQALTFSTHPDSPRSKQSERSVPPSPNAATP